MLNMAYKLIHFYVNMTNARCACKSYFKKPLYMSIWDYKKKKKKTSRLGIRYKGLYYPFCCVIRIIYLKAY